jgi:hypothetical protein
MSLAKAEGHVNYSCSDRFCLIGGRSEPRTGSRPPAMSRNRNVNRQTHRFPSFVSSANWPRRWSAFGEALYRTENCAPAAPRDTTETRGVPAESFVSGWSTCRFPRNCRAKDGSRLQTIPLSHNRHIVGPLPRTGDDGRTPVALMNVAVSFLAELLKRHLSTKSRGWRGRSPGHSSVWHGSELGG